MFVHVVIRYTCLTIMYTNYFCTKIVKKVGALYILSVDSDTLAVFNLLMLSFHVCDMFNLYAYSYCPCMVCSMLHVTYFIYKMQYHMIHTNNIMRPYVCNNPLYLNQTVVTVLQM